MMKILFFCFKELGGLGGVEVLVLSLAKGLKALGHSVGILEIAKHPEPLRHLPDGIPVWGVTAPSYPAIRRPRSWASFLRTSAQFLAVVHKFDPDIVNVHFPLSQCIPVVGAHLLPHRWRLVVSVHGSDVRVSPFKELEILPWQTRAYRHASAVTAVNQALLDDAISTFPIIASKGKVILTGVGKQWFQPLESTENGDDYILFVGRLSYGKGVDLLMEAWGSVCRFSPRTRLWLAGDGDERKTLETMARDLGILDSVNFMGRKNQEELTCLYRNARAVVLPSRREGLPLTLLEAGAAGAICVGSRTPGIPEIIRDGSTGYLVETDSVADLCAGLKKVLDLPMSARARMKQAAQEFIRSKFSEERMLANYLELFQSVQAD